jgi:hypothetical protein
LFAPRKVNTLKVLILEQNISASERHEATLKDYAWKSAHTAIFVEGVMRRLTYIARAEYQHTSRIAEFRLIANLVPI